MISFKRFKEFLRVAFGPKVSWRDYLEILKSAITIAGAHTRRRCGGLECLFVISVPYSTRIVRPVDPSRVVKWAVGATLPIRH